MIRQFLLLVILACGIISTQAKRVSSINIKSTPSVGHQSHRCPERKTPILINIDIENDILEVNVENDVTGEVYIIDENDETVDYSPYINCNFDIHLLPNGIYTIIIITNMWEAYALLEI